MEAIVDVPAFVFDLVLVASLVSCAAILLTTPDLFKAIVLFIVFGLLMSVVWGRLEAVDIALAEAAIGAGITGALLLNAYGELEARKARDGEGEPLAAARDPRGDGAPTPNRESRPVATKVASAMLALLSLAAFAWAVLSAPSELAGVRPWVEHRLPESGVENPVTAVLLNFRAWDTLLEVAVLLLAVVGIWSQRLPRVELDVAPPGKLLVAAVRLLAPVTVLVGGYLLWQGTRAPGGAFQAGAVMAGAAIFVLLAEHPLSSRWAGIPLRAALALGVIVFVGVGLGAVLSGHPFLFYRGGLAAHLILAIEVTATITIALALTAAFAGRPPASRQEGPSK